MELRPREMTAYDARDLAAADYVDGRRLDPAERPPEREGLPRVEGVEMQRADSCLELARKRRNERRELDGLQWNRGKRVSGPRADLDRQAAEGCPPLRRDVDGTIAAVTPL